MEELKYQNQLRWNEIASLHFKSDYYQTEKFIADKSFSTLSAIEKRELWPMKDKSLLHLQCHIGTDTLSLARHGANVTGVDFSENSIACARELSERSGTKGKFIASDIYMLPATMQEQFDIVYSNWGSLCWLPDHAQWAKIASNLVKPGGNFYMAEIHPYGLVSTRTDVVTGWQYFPSLDNVPTTFSHKKSYASENCDVENDVFHQWSYTMAEIVTGLVSNGLQIEFLHEHPEAVYRQQANMIQLESGLFVPPDQQKMPLSFTLKAFKPNQI